MCMQERVLAGIVLGGLAILWSSCARSDPDGRRSTDGFWEIASSQRITKIPGLECIDNATISAPESAGAMLLATMLRPRGWRARRRGPRSDAGEGHACSPVPCQSLERRVLMSSMVAPSIGTAPYIPPQHYLWAEGGYLTSPSADDPLVNAMRYLGSHPDAIGLEASDLRQVRVTDEYTDLDTGVTHIYLRQQLNGLDIANANLSVNVAKDGRLINVAGGFVSGLAQMAETPSLSPYPRLAAEEALNSFEKAIYGAEDETRAQVIRGPEQADAAQFLSDADISSGPILARLVYTATHTGVKLAWNVLLDTADGIHAYDACVDASNGNLLSASDEVRHATYNVLPAPTESPIDGARVLVNDPVNAEASPYGWHDTNGTAGPEYTYTRGNNVWAQDYNRGAGRSPDGGADLVFNFPLDLGLEPPAYWESSATNLFYWNNLLHDVHSRYGFTEQAGNFQETNYTGEGAGGDAVHAYAQWTIWGVVWPNNADFFTPPEGDPLGRVPQMRVGLFNRWTIADADFDNMIVVHEYGHGVSDRLTGGPGNSDALVASQSCGMAEGWSDWWSLMFTQKPGDAEGGDYVVGPYVTAGSGARTYPYSTNMGAEHDPRTLRDYNSMYLDGLGRREPHLVGEIWCSALWDLSWALIGKYGFSSDIASGYTGPGSAGNVLALKLVMDALKLQPANPTFLQARNAILQADEILTGGVNRNDIWAVFARRGFGFSADVGADATETIVTPAFDLPPAGTSSDDSIRLAPESNPNLVDIFINNPGPTPTVTANLGNVGRLVVDGRGGNDVIDASAMAAGVMIVVGNGNDNIIAGGGDDTIVSSGGNDTVRCGTGADVLIVTNTGVVNLVETTTLRSLTLADTARLNLTAGGNKYLKLSLASTSDLNIGPTATLDLFDNDMIVQAGSATDREALLATLAGLIGRARNGGAWNKAGVTSTTAKDDRIRVTGLAAIRNSERTNPVESSWQGQAVDANSILVKYTFNGDADLNGILDGSDYFFIDKGYLSRNSANPLKGYHNGDFDYSGMIDGSDFFLIDKAFLAQKTRTLPFSLGF